MTNKTFNCNICKSQTDVINGGIALMMALCIKSTTNLINIALCENCYKELAEKPLKELNEVAKLNINFGESGSHEN